MQTNVYSRGDSRGEAGEGSLQNNKETVIYSLQDEYKYSPRKSIYVTEVNQMQNLKFFATLWKSVYYVHH